MRWLPRAPRTRGAATETGRSREFWSKFAEIGVPGLLVPEEHGGHDLVLGQQRVGRVAARTVAPAKRGEEHTQKWVETGGGSQGRVGIPIEQILAHRHGRTQPGDGAHPRGLQSLPGAAQVINLQKPAPRLVVDDVKNQ